MGNTDAGQLIVREEKKKQDATSRFRTHAASVSGAMVDVDLVDVI